MRVLFMSSILGSITELHSTLPEKVFTDFGTGLILNLGIHLEEVLVVQCIQVNSSENINEQV